MRKNELPAWAEKYKEKGKTIKVRKGKYYLYQSKCVYDKNKKNKNKTINTYLGTITEERGFIPAKNYADIKPESLYSKIYGHFALFKHLGGNILERLIVKFGEEKGVKIFTIAVLRSIENTPYYQLEDAFEESYYSVEYKNLSMSKSSLSDLLKELARYKTNMLEFMKEDIDEDDIIIFDGTNFLCGGYTISYRGYGYKHGHNYSSQINELYAYSVKNRKPVYFKLLEGSVPDKATLKDVIQESGIKNSISLIDKGFNSDSNISGLLENKNKYIMPLNCNSKLVPEEILNDVARTNAKELFILNKETISSYETRDEDNNRICIYFNSTIASVEETEYVDKMNRKVKNYTMEKYQTDKKRFGIYVIKTNIEDFNLEKIYNYYSSRAEVEYMFDTIKNTLGYDKSYMRSDETIESWAFINHISILLTQKVYDEINNRKIKITVHELFRKLRQVKKVTNNLDKDGSYKLQVVPKKTREILEKLEIIL